MASKRAASISDAFLDVELAFFQAGSDDERGDETGPTADEGRIGRRAPSFWTRLLGRLRR